MPRGGKRPGAGRPPVVKLAEHERSKVASFTLSPAALELLNKYAAEEKKSKSWLVDQAIRQFLNQKPATQTTSKT